MQSSLKFSPKSSGNNYDWIVIGAGITGACLAYELVKQGLKVLLLDRELTPPNATRYSYGGLAYWYGTTPLTRQLCAEGIELHRNLSDELDANTEFREIDLLLTIPKGEVYQQDYDHFAIKPELLDLDQALVKEPRLNPEAIAGVLRFPHGQINPLATTQAYQRAFSRLGGEFKIEGVSQLKRLGNSIDGVVTSQNYYSAANTVVCAGGFSVALLQRSGIPYPVNFTHSQVIVTPPVDIRLQSLIMPASLQRFQLEKDQNLDPLLDVGAISFPDGHFLLGQISAINSDPEAILDSIEGETRIREGIRAILPSLADLPGTLYNCLVAFADPNQPLVGPLEDYPGLHLFTGFTFTLVLAPPLARHFALRAIGNIEPIWELMNA
ncbi:FAD-binding oxidoreductase [Gloeocapsa sp. PCC 73106]|uniref:NAD(P)/FAD-dependent oxidoreductase n=1 Tax=Gloeocapsa sp. PCC 73106 TaxID=102232 RepID=UPI0002AC0348|nr:FAD-binding oxidoreductase [Gloeocapsa sp. PCC 73106]ELR96950.1 glycine/D-amino acid oxidase, deaminating [Gloeocapsa sp. PCC 73106]